MDEASNMQDKGTRQAFRSEEIRKVSNSGGGENTREERKDSKTAEELTANTEANMKEGVRSASRKAASSSNAEAVSKRHN